MLLAAANNPFSFRLPSLSRLVYPHFLSGYLSINLLDFRYFQDFLSVFGFQGTGFFGFLLSVSFQLPSSGDGEIRTLDPLLARQVLSQLSYAPIESGSHLLSHAVPSIVPSAA